eukprot:4812876-Prymnesium_polylepis.1
MGDDPRRVGTRASSGPTRQDVQAEAEDGVQPPGSPSQAHAIAALLHTAAKGRRHESPAPQRVEPHHVRR